MATYHRTSDSLEAVNEIASRRQSLHYLRDRRVSMEKKTEWGAAKTSGLKGNYRAWGRTNSGEALEAMLTIKEINVLWVWFQQEVGVTTKQAMVEIYRFVGVFAKEKVFHTYDHSEKFAAGVERDDTRGAICFADIMTAMSDEDVTREEVYMLRQFVKKLRALKKERKKRQTADSTTNRSSFRLEASFSKGQEAALRSKYDRASSDPMLNITEGCPPRLDLSEIKEREESKDGKCPSSRLPFLKSNSMKNKNPSSSRTLSPPPSARKYLDRSTSRNEDQTLRRKPSQSPPPSARKHADGKASTRVAPKLSKSSHTFSSLNISLSDIDNDPGNSLQAAMSPVKSPRRLDPLSDSARPTSRKNKDITEGKKVSPVKILLPDKSVQPITSPKPLKSVRKEFHRKLSRMSSSEIGQEDEDLPIKPVGANRRVDLSSNSFRQKRGCGRNLDLQKTDSNMSIQENSARSTINRADSNVSAASDSKKSRERRQKVTRSDSNVSTGSSSRKRHKEKREKERNEKERCDKEEGDAKSDDVKVLKTLRKSYSRQLSRMSSLGADNSEARRTSTSAAGAKADPDILEIRRIGSGDSIDSINSFGSDHLIRFRNHSSKNESFGESILLRKMSSNSLASFD